VTMVRAKGLEVDTDYDNGRTLIALTGEVDAYSAAVLRQELVALDAAGHHRIAIDLRSMTYCDSSGLGVLVGAVKRAAAGGGGVALFGVAENFLKTLRITGLSKVIPAFADRPEALGWLDAQ
jgi:anti-sigma B factor antagonist